MDVRRLAETDVPRVVSVLAESFYDYPVMRYVLGAAGDYDGRLDRLVTFFVMNRVLKNEWMFGLADSRDLLAAVLVSTPATKRAPAALVELRERTWEQLGADARARYDAFGDAADRIELPPRHIHINMIGVRRTAQRRGLGRRLLEHVHAMSRASEASDGVSLTTEVAENVPYYEQFGYRVVGSVPVDSAFETRVMYREDRMRSVPGRA